MNNIKKKIATAIAASAFAAPVMAQEASTGYFLENNNTRWEMNPAFGNRNGYVGFPGLGNLNLGASGNLNPTDIVYTHNGKTVLFTNPDISAGEVLGNLSDVNRFSTNVKVGILQFGFKAFGGYNNIAINANTNVSAHLPKSVFSLLKEGVSNRTYDITDLRAKGYGYGEIVFNHSRDIKQVKGLRVGVSLKAILPLAYAEADFDQLKLQLGEDSWNAVSNARLRIGIKDFRYKMDYNDRSGHQYVNGFDTDDMKVGINGFGFGIDLGAIYRWNDFNFSLAFTDLGTISYSSVREASTNGTKTFQTEDHVLNVGDDDRSWDAFSGELSKLYELEDNGETSARTALAGKFRAGVDYTFPLYRRLHFGLLNTTNLSSIFPMTEFRLSANVEPIKGIAASISGAAGTYGANWGFLLSLGNKYFNFLVGMDYTNLKMDKNHIPLHNNIDVHMGINFPF